LKRILILLLASAPLCFGQAPPHQLLNGSSFVEPNFLLPENSEVDDYRPVLNAEGTMLIFERNPTAMPSDVKLYSADLATMDVIRKLPLDTSGLVLEQIRKGPHKRPGRIQQCQWHLPR